MPEYRGELTEQERREVLSSAGADYGPYIDLVRNAVERNPNARQHKFGLSGDEVEQRRTHKRRFKATTDSKHTLPVTPNRLDRNFETERPDQAWTADITYLTTGEGWLYLAAVEDLYSRRVVGWSMADHLESRLVVDALELAVQRRLPGEGLLAHGERLLAHSDRGSQHAS